MNCQINLRLMQHMLQVIECVDNKIHYGLELPYVSIATILCMCLIPSMCNDFGHTDYD